MGAAGHLRRKPTAGGPIMLSRGGFSQILLATVLALVGCVVLVSLVSETQIYHVALAESSVGSSDDSAATILVEAPPAPKSTVKAKATPKVHKKDLKKMASSSGAAAILAKAKAKMMQEKIKGSALKVKSKAEKKKAAQKQAKKAKAVKRAAKKAKAKAKAKVKKARKAAKRSMQKAHRILKRSQRRAKRAVHQVHKALAKQKIREADATIAARKVAAARAEAGAQAAHNMHVAARAQHKAAKLKAAVQRAIQAVKKSGDPNVQAEVKVIRSNLHKSLRHLHHALKVSQDASVIAAKAAGATKLVSVDVKNDGVSSNNGVSSKKSNEFITPQSHQDNMEAEAMRALGNE